MAHSLDSLTSLLYIYLPVLFQFNLCLFLQIVLWRALQAKYGMVPRQMLLLFLLFGAVPFLHLATHQSLDLLITALALGGTYIMSFPAAAAQSPTILLIDELNRHPGGLTKQELADTLNRQVQLVGDRVSDLKADGLAAGEGASARPSLVGRTLGYLFWSYRRALGLPIGGG